MQGYVCIVSLEMKAMIESCFSGIGITGIRNQGGVLYFIKDLFLC
jgi:hypothetical protein